MKSRLFKNSKGSFKGTLLRIGIILLIAFMVFGAMKSCVKVNAETDSLEIGYNYYWDTTQVADWCKSFTISSNTYAYATASRFFQYFDLEFDTIRIKRFYPEPVHDEYSIIYYNSSNGTEMVLYNCVWDRSGQSPVLLIYKWYGNTSIYITNNVITYSGMNQDKLFSILTLGDYDIYQSSYNKGYQDGYNSGSNMNLTSTYNQGYNTGYDEGYSAGYSYGHDIGYDDGVEDGSSDFISTPQFENAINNSYTDGYNDGYTEGTLSGNPYTFKNLFFAVFDVPVQVITGLFNWNFLGVNLKDFVFTILTLGLIAFLIKRIL